MVGVANLSVVVPLCVESVNNGSFSISFILEIAQSVLNNEIIILFEQELAFLLVVRW